VNWVDYLPYAFFGLAGLVLLVAVFASFSIRRSVAKHDEAIRQRVEQAARTKGPAIGTQLRVRIDGENSTEFFEVDGPTDRPYLRREWT
jgi:hypothetical protein